MPTAIQAEFKLFGVIKRKGDWYVAYCPPLDITTQARSLEEAQENLKQACSLFLTSCFERGTFEQAVRELGWTVSKSGRSTPKATEIPRGAFRFPVPIPFGFENGAECLA